MEKIKKIAYECLQKGKVREFPVNTIRLAKKLGYEVLPISASNTIGYDSARVKNDGAAVFANNRYYILYKDGLNPLRRNQVIAHELGHLVLHYDEKSPYYIGVFNENKEEEANRFERYIIAPVYFLDRLLIKNAQEIQEETGYSYDESKEIYKDLAEYWKAMEYNYEVSQIKKHMWFFDRNTRKKIKAKKPSQKKKQRVFDFVFLAMLLVVIWGFIWPPIIGDNPDVYISAQQGLTYHYDNCPVVVRRGTENMIRLKRSDALAAGYTECDCAAEGER